MDVRGWMEKHGLDDADLDRLAAPYERGDWEPDGGKAVLGSHVDAVAAERASASNDDGEDDGGRNRA